MIAFYDTSSLLLAQDKAFAEHFIISSITLGELEHIKTSDNRSQDIKYRARKLVHLLDEHRDAYTVVHENTAVHDAVDKHFMPQTNDNIIMASASMTTHDVFYSEDLCMRIIGKDVFGLEAKAYDVGDLVAEYTGYTEVVVTDSQLSSTYGEMDNNRFNCLINEYVILRNTDGDVVDALKWDGARYQQLKKSNFKSSAFGVIKPYRNDIYQQLAFDCLLTNKVTLLKGPAGTGKSLLALGYLMRQLESRQIDKIIVFCNPLATAQAARLGFYPGTRDQKILDSATGAMLSSKFGDKFRVEQLCAEGKLVLLPLSDIRGYDTSNMNAGVYVVEAQNMDISLAKLVMQRIGDDSICIIDGDYNTQVDSKQFEGTNNGMRRISEIFRNEPCYGEVELQNIYRSEIARIAENM